MLSDTSDHFPLLTNFTIQHKDPKPNDTPTQGFLTWKLYDENLETLKQVLESTSWDNVMKTEDVNGGFEDFHNTFMRKNTDCRSKKVPGRLDGKINPSVLGLVMDCSSVLIRNIRFRLIT